jgi:uncharacterized protein
MARNKKKDIVILLIVLLVLFGLFYLTVYQNDSEEAYVEQILKEREEKDRLFREGSDSPFAANRQAFKGLQYFEPDYSLRIQAKLTIQEERKTRTLGTNDGREKTYREFGLADFSIDGVPQRLLILEVIERGPFKGTLFLAFGDDTSAQETYGAGRYLDVKALRTDDVILLDFNKAYNPYCAYSDGFTCPLPPRENLLTVPIRAGEKTY